MLHTSPPALACPPPAQVCSTCAREHCSPLLSTSHAICSSSRTRFTPAPRIPKVSLQLAVWASLCCIRLSWPFFPHPPACLFTSELCHSSRPFVGQRSTETTSTPIFRSSQAQYPVPPPISITPPAGACTSIAARASAVGTPAVHSNRQSDRYHGRYWRIRCAMMRDAMRTGGWRAAGQHPMRRACGEA